jgi:hypothetical protein
LDVAIVELKVIDGGIVAKFGYKALRLEDPDCGTKGGRGREGFVDRSVRLEKREEWAVETE